MLIHVKSCHIMSYHVMPCHVLVQQVDTWYSKHNKKTKIKRIDMVWHEFIWDFVVLDWIRYCSYWGNTSNGNMTNDELSVFFDTYLYSIDVICVHYHDLHYPSLLQSWFIPFILFILVLFFHYFLILNF